MKMTLRASIAMPSAVHGIRIAGTRVAVGTGERWTILDSASGKVVVALAKGAGIAAIDAAGTRAVVTPDSRQVRGVRRWRDELWDLVRGKRVATLAEHRPEDRWGMVELGASAGVAVHCVRRGSKSIDSLVRFDLAGKKPAPIDETRLVGAPMVFRIAVSPDGRVAAHAYFDGRGGLVEYLDGKPPRRRKLGGRITGIGRDHDQGVGELAFDPTGAYLLALTHMGQRATVWSAATGKVVTGAWSKLRIDDAFFVGDALCVTRADTLGRLPLGRGPVGAPITVGGHPALVAPLGDDRHVVWSGATDRSHDKALRAIEIWDIVARKRVAALKHPATLRGVQTLAAAPGVIALGTRDGQIRLFAVR